MKSSKPPKFNADKAISQSNQQNTANAYQNAAFNRVNQTDQFGNTLNYNQTGTDAQGNPIFSATQGLGATGQQYAGGLAQLGQSYFNGAQNMLANPFDGTSQGAFDQAYNYASANLEPRLEQQRAALDTRLRNQGLSSTSAAYRTAMNDLALQGNEARNNLVTGLQGQLFNQGLQGRQQQVNELTGLTAPGMQFGNAVLGGNYVNVPGVNVQNTDVAGLYGKQYESQLAAWQAQQQQQNAMLGGLASLGGSILAAPMTGGTSLLGAGLGKIGNLFGGRDQGLGSWGATVTRA